VSAAAIRLLCALVDGSISRRREKLCSTISPGFPDRGQIVSTPYKSKRLYDPGRVDQVRATW